MYCNNCRKQGHISKDCILPITSYGVLLIDIKDEPKIAMIKRKDSLCYIDLIRGKYKIENIEYIKLLISRISRKEKKKILKYNFDIIWKKLWLIHDLKQMKYMNEYNRSKLLFDELKQNKEIIEYIKKYNEFYDNSEWEFPKGKKNYNEKNYECAKRELCEETNIDMNDFKLIQNISPIIESFMGENKVNYRNIYYIGILKNKDNLILNTNNKLQCLEISDVQLLNKNESINKIRKYNNTKLKIIELVFNFIHNYQNNMIIK